MNKTNENYEKYKNKISKTAAKNGKGKLAPHRELIEKMIEDELTQKQMREFLKQEFDIEIGQANFSLFVKKLKAKKIIKMELINGTNFVATPLAQVKEKKLKTKNIATPDSIINKSNSSDVKTQITKKETNSIEEEFKKIREDRENEFNAQKIELYNGVEYDISSPLGRLELANAKANG